jgi:acetyl-CoA acetyltransferase
MLMGGHVTTSLVEQLPLPAWRGDAGDRRITRLSARMALEPRAPRAHARLQQAVARRYGVTRDEFAQILDGFPLVDEGDRRLALEGFAL